MLELNDDCLLHIFRELNIREQLMAAGTCERFRVVIVELIWRCRFREICTNDEETMTLHADEYQQFFALNVVHLQKLTIMDTRTWAFTSYLGRYFRPELAFYFTFTFPELNELNCQDATLHDGHLRLVAERCANLRVLRLSTDYVTGLHIKDMHQLRELHVPRSSLETKHLEAILRQLPLTHLNMTGISPHCELGEALSTLSGTALCELQLSECDIDEAFLKNYHKLRSLKVLQVNEVSHMVNGQWPSLLQIIGAQTKALYIENTSTYTSAVQIIATHISLLCKLQKLYIAPQSEIIYANAFCQLTTLKELHVVLGRYLIAVLPLIGNCAGLEHIYLERRRPEKSVLLQWADSLIELLQRQNPPHSVLTIHIKEYPPMYEEKVLQQHLQTKHPQQNVVKCVTEIEKSVQIFPDQSFVRFEFE